MCFWKKILKNLRNFNFAGIFYCRFMMGLAQNFFKCLGSFFLADTTAWAIAWMPSSTTKKEVIQCLVIFVRCGLWVPIMHIHRSSLWWLRCPKANTFEHHEREATRLPFFLKQPYCVLCLPALACLFLPSKAPPCQHFDYLSGLDLNQNLHRNFDQVSLICPGQNG